MDPTVAYRVKTFDTALHVAVFPIPGGDAYEKKTIPFARLGVELDPEADRGFHDEPVVKFKCKNPNGMTTFDIKWDIDLDRETLTIRVEDHINAIYNGSNRTFKLSHLGLRPASN